MPCAVCECGQKYSTPTFRNALPFTDWWTWCQTCRHGGHASHLAEWFTNQELCPVADCTCHCNSLDSTPSVRKPTDLLDAVPTPRPNSHRPVWAQSPRSADNNNNAPVHDAVTGDPHLLDTALRMTTSFHSRGPTGGSGAYSFGRRPNNLPARHTHDTTSSGAARHARAGSFAQQQQHHWRGEAPLPSGAASSSGAPQGSGGVRGSDGSVEQHQGGGGAGPIATGKPFAGEDPRSSRTRGANRTPPVDRRLADALQAFGFM